MSDVSFTLELVGDVSAFTESVQDEMTLAIATQAGVNQSAVTITITSGSVILDVAIRVPSSAATTVQSTMAAVTSTPSGATTMLSAVSGVNITVAAVTTQPVVAPLEGTVSATGGLDGGAIFGIIIGVLALCACLAVGILWKLNKLPAKLQLKLNKVAPAPRVEDASIVELPAKSAAKKKRKKSSGDGSD